MDKKKVPEVRFKGFSGDWERRKFSVVYSHIQNNTLSRAELNYESGIAKNIHYGDVLIKFGECLDVQKAELPMILSESVVAKYKTSFLRNGDVIMADTAEDETVCKCCEIIGLNNEKVLSGLHTIPCRPNWQFAENFLGYYMNSSAYRDQLRPLMQGIKVTSVSKTALQDTDIVYPKEISEQTAIGNFFRNLDKLITGHQRKHNKLVTVKKAMLGKMFPKDGTHVPEVRFKGFSRDWERKKLGEIADRVVRKNTNLESTLPLTISAQHGLVDQITYFNNRVASRDISNYYLLKRGEFAYNKSYSSGYPFGAIKRLDYYEMGVLSTLYIIFTPKINIINSDYLVSYYDTDNWHKQVAEKAAEGARNHGLLNISTDDFFNTELNFPVNIAEQTAIGNFFRNLDKLISQHQRELEKLKTIKKAMLGKMFV